MATYRSASGVVAVMASGTQRASLNAFVASLPEWLPLPVVLGVRDLEEEGEAFLARLRHGCILPVHDVQERCELKAGHVYVSSAGDALCLDGGQVFVPHLRSAEGTALLSSAAATFGTGAVAILLGGAIESSAPQARKVVWAGGTVFAHQIHEEPPVLVQNGIARAYKCPEYLAEALSLVCSGLQTRRAV